MDTPWYRHSYRRVLLDMHVPAWDDRFLTHYDPETYLKAVRSVNAGAVTTFSNTHTGLANYPSKVGPMHPAFDGRDILGETIALCRRHGLAVTCYYCVNYVDWYWDTHPEARTVDANGQSQKVLIPSTGQPRRFSVCCMNNPGYREFAVAQLTDPPGMATSNPALVRRRYGAGQAIYAAGTPEIGDHDSQRVVFVNLLRHLARRPFAFEVAAPKSIEVTLYYDDHAGRYLINLLNVQSDLPNIPVTGFPMRVRLDGRRPLALEPRCWLPLRRAPGWRARIRAPCPGSWKCSSVSETARTLSQGHASGNLPAR